MSHGGSTIIHDIWLVRSYFNLIVISFNLGKHISIKDFLFSFSLIIKVFVFKSFSE